jgi:hypothetical protein
MRGSAISALEGRRLVPSLEPRVGDVLEPVIVTVPLEVLRDVGPGELVTA